MGFSDYDDGDVAAADDGDGGSSKTIKPMRMTANMSKNMKTKPARRTMKLLSMAMVFWRNILSTRLARMMIMMIMMTVVTTTCMITTNGKHDSDNDYDDGQF